MGFYDELGQAPSSGGGLGLDLLGGLPQLGGSIVNAVSARKTAERQRRTQNDELRLRQQDLALKAAEFNRQAIALRMANALRGDVLAGVQPFQLTGEGRTLGATGGLSPALISAGSRQLGQDVSRQALLSQLGGSQGPYQNDRARFTAMRDALQTSPPAAGGGAFSAMRRLQEVARQARGQAGSSSILPMPDPYTWLPFGGAPVSGGPDSLWPNTRWS